MRPALPRLHAFTDERIARRADLSAIARALHAAAGDDLALHARGHTLTGREHFDLAFRLSVSPSIRLFVNDRLDVALAARAAGVQLGRDGLAPADARRLGPEWWIGASVHDRTEAAAARDTGADYLVVGAVYATATHPERAPIGLDVLHDIATLGLPVIAIGGVTPARARAVRAAGAWGVAAISALWDAPDPGSAARAMLEGLR